jgi:hypothetical protein
MQEAANRYLLEGYKDNEGVIPSVAGLACYLGVSRSTIYEWRDNFPDFSDTLQAIDAKQEHLALNGGMANKFNATIAKLVLANHGYSDRTQTDLTSSDGTMTPPQTVQFVIVDPNDDAEG